MSDNFKSFIETLESPNTVRVIRSLQAIGNYDYTNCTHADLENVILSMKPNSPKTIVTMCWALGLYARYLEDDRLYNMVQELDRSDLWVKAKPTAGTKFISYPNYKQTCHIISMHEEMNALYTETLFRCLFEGVYNDDMSVIKNMRASDIRGNTITLREDNGYSYDLEISEDLARDLIELSESVTQDRKNRYGIFQMSVEGLYPDSCFKVEVRKDNSDYSYRYSYYRILRKIAKEYLGYNLLPLQIYISGMMYRIRLKLQEHNISLEDAFSEHSRNKTASRIISDELKRCNYNTDIRNFRQIVKGHLEIFDMQ